MYAVDQETIDRVFSMITKFPDHRCVELINMYLGDTLESLGVSITSDGDDAVVNVASGFTGSARLPQRELLEAIKTLGGIFIQLANVD